MRYIQLVDDPPASSREMSLRELRNFVTLAETGSVTAAAEIVGLSQPAMSTSLANLERSLGVSLFVRHRGRGVNLTPEGRALAHDARQLLQQADEIHARISSAGHRAAGPVRVGSLVTVAPIVLPALIRAFNDAHPELAVHLWTGSQDLLLGWLRDGEIHVAITYDLDLPDAFEFRPLADAVPRVVLPASHPLAVRTSLHLLDLVDVEYILLDLPLSREYFTSLFLASGAQCKPAMRVTDLGLVRSLVANGFGYSLVNLRPRSTQALDGGELSYVRLQSAVPPLRLGIAWLATSSQPRAVESFAAFASHAVVDAIG
jgi:DNA-binding transcriptional LysR family regulator